jgi:hypothetical protein
MRPIWRVLLGLYFLIIGAIALLNLTFDGLPQIMGLFAMALAVVIWLDK